MRFVRFCNLLTQQASTERRFIYNNWWR